jgi:hypothetical protein
MIMTRFLKTSTIGFPFFSLVRKTLSAGHVVHYRILADGKGFGYFMATFVFQVGKIEYPGS